MATSTGSEILAAIAHLGANAYGKTIHDVLGGRLSFGSLYAMLRRLEELGFIRTWRAPGGPERGGRDKLCVGLTPRGRALLEEVPEHSAL